MWTSLLGTGNVALPIDRLEAAAADSYVEINVTCVEEQAKKGWGIGGLAFVDWTVEKGSKFEFAATKDSVLELKYVVKFSVADILKEIKATGTEEMGVVFYNGFEAGEVYLVQPKK